MISHKHKCIFVHIEKTAGTSIEDAINGKKWSPVPSLTSHKTIEQYKKDEPEYFEKYYKFTFVRNPWDRVLSIFLYCLRGGDHSKEDTKIANEMEKDFERFCRKILIEKKGHRWVISKCRGQLERITIDGKIGVDFIGRFERLEEDCKKVFSHLGINARLPHVRRNKHAPYWTYYNKETVDIVAKAFKEEIEYFSYTFR